MASHFARSRRHLVLSILYSTLLLLLIPFATAELHSQVLDNFLKRSEIGAGYLRVSTRWDPSINPDADTAVVRTTGALVVTTGINIPIVEFADQFGLGINPDIQYILGEMPYSSSDPQDLIESSDIGIRFAIPVLVTLKYGTDATMTPNTSIGAGIGVGYQLSAVPTFELFYHNPIAAGEFSFLVGDSVVKLRAVTSLLPATPADGVEVSSLEFSILLLTGK